MQRSGRGDSKYWDKWVRYMDEHLADVRNRLRLPPGDPSYRSQYLYTFARAHWEAMLYRYSRGDALSELQPYWVGMLDAWEESERLGAQVYTPEQQFARNSWSVNLDHYIVCFWLVGLAYALNISDDLWLRLLALVGNEGGDALLDRVIAVRQKERIIGSKLCFPTPYARLFDAMNAPESRRVPLIREFLGGWLVGLGSVPGHSYPYWYKYGDVNFEGGSYFGCWCIEAAAVVKVMGVDDAELRGCKYYPADLVSERLVGRGGERSGFGVWLKKALLVGKNNLRM